MFVARSLRASVVGVVLAFSIGAGAAGAQTPPLLPPGGPGAFPAGAPADCPGGELSCVDRTVAEMYRRINSVVGVCDHRAVFALAYLRVTEDLRRAAGAGRYDDPQWFARTDVVFGDLYVRAYDDWVAGRRDSVPPAWRLGFTAAEGHDQFGLINFLVEFSAHVTRDLPFVLEKVGLARADGTSHKADFDRVNDTVAAVHDPVVAEIADRFDPTVDDLAATGLDGYAPAVFRAWRLNAWRNAERLVTARTPQARAMVARSIELQAEAKGREILAAAPHPGPDGIAARDAWCAQHGGQRPDAYRRPADTAVRARRQQGTHATRRVRPARHRRGSRRAAGHRLGSSVRR